jgi:hypothetical protein
MRRSVFGLAAAALLAVVSAVPALAGPPAKFQVPLTILFPDTSLGLVVMINTDRASYCTPEVVAWEEAFIAWLEGGEVGDPPAEPTFPDGFEPISIQEVETGKGAIVSQTRASGLKIEIWELEADAPLVGPCTDTDANLDRIGVGTVSYHGNDNDLFGSGTRGNAFGDRGQAVLVGDDGGSLRYSWLFHTNSRCFAPDGGPPSCLIERSSLR